jgi:integrase/recombinase XerD
MSMFSSTTTTPVVVRTNRPLFDEAQLAAVAFLARYGGRTLESYRADLRQFFQCCADVEVAPLVATRTHIELYRASMDKRGLAPATIDRRLSTVCGYYRFAHIDGRITSNPAQYVRRPASTRPPSEAWTAANWRRSCTPPSGRHRCMPPWPCCSA